MYRVFNLEILSFISFSWFLRFSNSVLREDIFCSFSLNSSSDLIPSLSNSCCIEFNFSSKDLILFCMFRFSVSNETFLISRSFCWFFRFSISLLIFDISSVSLDFCLEAYCRVWILESVISLNPMISVGWCEWYIFPQTGHVCPSFSVSLIFSANIWISYFDFSANRFSIPLSFSEMLFISLSRLFIWFCEFFIWFSSSFLCFIFSWITANFFSSSSRFWEDIFCICVWISERDLFMFSISFRISSLFSSSFPTISFVLFFIWSFNWLKDLLRFSNSILICYIRLLSSGFLLVFV